MMVRSIALFGALVVVACSTQPPPTGPGVATIEIIGQHGECGGFGGCMWVAILSEPDERETLTNRSVAELNRVFETADLTLGHGLPQEIPDGHYRLSFEERRVSDSQGNGPLQYSVGTTCARDFLIGPGRSVVVARVSFPTFDRNDSPAPCSVDLKVEEVP